MQRLSNTALSVALTLFVTSVSLVLLAAAWLIATFLTSEPIQPIILK